MRLSHAVATHLFILLFPANRADAPCFLAAPPPRRYNPELTAQWTREIADEIKNRIKNELELPRYKFVVQVVVGEQRGEGVRMGCRCFWDADTDNYAEDTYRNVRAAAAALPCRRLHKAAL